MSGEFFTGLKNGFTMKKKQIYILFIDQLRTPIKFTNKLIVFFSKSVKINFFPPNCTIRLQTLGLDIIKYSKDYYRIKNNSTSDWKCKQDKRFKEIKYFWSMKYDLHRMSSCKVK